MVNARTLVNTGVLVRTGVFGQVVNIDTGFTGDHFFFVYFNNNAAGVDIINCTTTLRYYCYARIFRYYPLNTGTYQRLISTQSWHGLTLHVRTHQGAVSIIVFQEWNKRCSNRYDLLWRNVHILNF